MLRSIFLPCFISLIISSCDHSNKHSSISNVTNKYTYLALGDSYTIGEAVQQEDSFPYQLQKLLLEKELSFGEPVILARTGWTTDELRAAINEENKKGKFDLVTLLIGVNNQYRGYSIESYRKEFISLLKTAISYSKEGRDHVFVLSIPDWGATKFGKESGRDIQQIAAEIDTFNKINK
ncbi:MAG: SGNH/GDSL hydrolase family protein, partial [Sphingobacteriales bacterium]